MLKTNIKSHIAGSYGEESYFQGHFSYHPLFIATSKDDSLDLGAECQWKDLDSLSVEEFADLVWKCLVEERSLKTVTMSKSEKEWLEKKAEERETRAKEAKEEKEAILQEAKKQEEKKALDDKK